MFSTTSTSRRSSLLLTTALFLLLSPFLAEARLGTRLFVPKNSLKLQEAALESAKLANLDAADRENVDPAATDGANTAL